MSDWKSCTRCGQRKTPSDFSRRNTRVESRVYSDDDITGLVGDDDIFDEGMGVVVKRSICRECEARRERFRRKTATPKDIGIEVELLLAKDEKEGRYGNY